MESYAQVLNFAIPFFILLIGIEALWSWKKGLKINRGPDMISSLSSGMTNTIKDVLGLSVVIISYGWLVEHIALFEIKSTWLVYLIAFVAIDFAGYWIHRLEHEINIFWNRHIIHHSSEEFNLSCALRQSISNITSFIAFFMIPAALVGVPEKVIAVIAPLHLFAQFWYHTRLIDKMGWFEVLFVTPSHHRVHHAINAEYLDKNYGQVFIFWDKIFGTFQPELKEIPPVYGVKRQVNTWNPFWINFQHFWLIFMDAWRTKSWKDKLKIWFKPTGWRPEDVAEKYPIEIIEDPYAQKKYDTGLSKSLTIWSWVQLVVGLILMLYMFNRIADYSFGLILLYGLFLGLSVFSYTTLMDKSKWAILTEFLRALFGLGLIYYLDGWFGMEQFIPFSGIILSVFFLFSLLMTIYFVKTEVVADDKASVAVS
ncbi:MAG: sterol desaturase family protein [Saprospiraceae bacterium]